MGSKLYTFNAFEVYIDEWEGKKFGACHRCIKPVPLQDNGSCGESNI